jgi:phosphoenolpyruvate carboxylase
MALDPSKMRPKQDADVARAQKMVEEIMEEVGILGGIELNDWEESFMESITDQLDQRRRLSPAQMEKLEEIWNKL